MVTGANPRIAWREQEASPSDLLDDAELAANSVHGSIPSLIAWTEPKPPSNAPPVSFFARGESLKERIPRHSSFRRLAEENPLMREVPERDAGVGQKGRTERLARSDEQDGHPRSGWPSCADASW